MARPSMELSLRGCLLARYRLSSLPGLAERPPLMTDIVSAAIRSRMMAGIKGKNTKPELHVRRFLHRKGFRYRLHDRGLSGKPDLVLKKHHCVIFVHGCFWHRHSGCRFATTPATRPEFWLAKLNANRERDVANQEKLVSTGWRIAVVWECALRAAPQATLDDLKGFILSSMSYQEFPGSQLPRTE